MIGNNESSQRSHLVDKPTSLLVANKPLFDPQAVSKQTEVIVAIDINRIIFFNCSSPIVELAYFFSSINLH
jgi:hypothetical protein